MMFSGVTAIQIWNDSVLKRDEIKKFLFHLKMLYLSYLIISKTSAKTNYYINRYETYR